MTWQLSPLTGFELNTDVVLPEIKTEDDVDRNVIDQIRDRIRYVTNNGRYETIPVLFYNENDRIKSLKSSPMVIVAPQEPALVDDHVLTGYDLEATGDDFYVNDDPVFHEFTYRLTVTSTEFAVYRRLSVFLRDVLFPRVGGQRWITISNENGENRRTLTIEGEAKTEDFENNYFQYDFSVVFRLGLYPRMWRKEQGITETNFGFDRGKDGSVDGEDQTYTLK